MPLSLVIPPGPPLADLLPRVFATGSAGSAALGAEACLDSSLCSGASLAEARVAVFPAVSFSPGSVRLLLAAGLLSGSDLLAADLVAFGVLEADVGLAGVVLVAEGGLGGALSAFAFPGA